MTEQTATQTVIVPAAKPDLAMTEYGSREDIEALARRIKSMLPGGDQLSLEQAMSLAQYSILLDANPYRGEVYAFVSRGKFHLVDGYKLLVRWAKRQCPYSERFEPLSQAEMPEGAIGYRCWILRDDARPLLQQLIQAGAPWQDAFGIAATSAIGIVLESDRTTRDGRPMDPPAGWTWDQVAEKRALKNALNRSHGAPSPREIAAMSWDVNGTHTMPADWRDCPPNLPAEARERLAEQKATARLAQPDPRTPAEILEAGNAILHQGAMEI